MSFIRKDISKTENRLGLLYLINFIVSFHLFFIVYFNSNFLNSEGISDKSISFVYIIGSILSIFGLFLLPKILNRVGNYISVLILIASEFAVFFILAFVENLTATIVAMVTYLLVYPLILVSFDIFLEGSIEDENTTGGIRGIFLTITNSALIIAPLSAGFLLNGGEFRYMYAVAGSFLIPLFIIIIYNFKKFKDPEYTKLKHKDYINEFKQKKDLSCIFISHLILRLFFSFMVIYTPLFLHNTIGFSFSEIGILFAIMLLPFAIFEIPLGKIADKWLGEKEILIVGLIITGLSTIAISFATSSGFLFWAVLLFLTRTGASAVEITTESYFFKHVDATDAGIITLFRTLNPLGYVAGPILGAITLSFVNIQFVFIVPGLILLAGVIFAYKIKDTK